MKKNLNIAYLNGAEGMIRRGGASSGGSGGSGSGEASTIEYLDTKEVDKPLRSFLMSVAFQVKGDTENGIVISYMFSAEDVSGISYDNSIAFCVDFESKVTPPGLGTMSAMELLNMVGITQEQLDAIPRITKEQFYSLE